MGLSLRIDVDNPFGYATFFKKVLNRFSLDYNIVPRWRRLGYLEHAMKLQEYLDTMGVSATWFFRNETAPPEHLLNIFTSGKNNIALHAQRTNTLEDFSQEILEWKGRFKQYPSGFSKHGSGDLKLARMHDMEYNPEKLLQFAQEKKMTFFIGNGIEYKESIQIREEVVYIPSIVWLDNLELMERGFSLDKVFEYSRDNPVILLIHPYWWNTQESVRNILDQVIQTTTLENLIEVINRMKSE